MKLGIYLSYLLSIIVTSWRTGKRVPPCSHCEVTDFGLPEVENPVMLFVVTCLFFFLYRLLLAPAVFVLYSQPVYIDNLEKSL